MPSHLIKRAADLFCGAGGTSTGYVRACAALDFTPELLAVNHWPTAVATHELNHPGVRHLCENLETISPAALIPGGHLDLLCASPECTHFSLAAGGRPRNDQSRAQAWQILRWATDLSIDNILIENVREFQNWGRLLSKPLRWRGQRYKAGRPDPRFKGEYFRAFIEGLRGVGYTVEFKILCAADYGDPTTRQRLFILARKGQAIQWPAPSHGKGGTGRAANGVGVAPWRAAREIIDWGLKGKSIFGRKKPLSPNTLRRIAAGLRKFGGDGAEPFLVMLYGTNDARSVHRPAPTVTGGRNHMGLAEPFVMQTDQTGGNGQYIRSPDDPLYTVVSKQNMAVVEPYLVNMKGQSNAASLGQPAPTVTAHAAHLYLAQPFAVSINHGESDDTRRSHSLGEPFPTVDCSNGKALVEPFLSKFHGDHKGRDSGAQRNHSVDEPVATLDTSNRFGLVQPYIVKFYGSGTAVDVNGPLDTVTSRDRFMLICPETGAAIAELDILFRMLQPHELAAAQGFPPNYQFAGTREERVKQIGNAVPVNLAQALCGALLGP